MNTERLIEVLPIDDFFELDQDLRRPKKLKALKAEIEASPDPAQRAREYKTRAFATFRENVPRPIRIEKFNVSEERAYHEYRPDYEPNVYFGWPNDPLFKKPFGPYRHITSAFALAYTESFLIGNINYLLPPGNPFAVEYNAAREAMLRFYRFLNVHKYQPDLELKELKEEDEYEDEDLAKHVFETISESEKTFVSRLTFQLMGMTTKFREFSGSTVPAKIMFELLLRSGMEPSRIKGLLLVLYAYINPKGGSPLKELAFEYAYDVHKGNGYVSDIFSNTPGYYELQLGPRPFQDLSELKSHFVRASMILALQTGLRSTENVRERAGLAYIDRYLDLAIADFKALLDSYVNQFNAASV